jgi:predicted transcriptional regulator
MELSEIKRLRQKVGLSQTDLAKKAGVSQAHIAKIEGGKVDPRFSTVERIMQCLKEEEKDHCSAYMTTTIYSVQASDDVSTSARLMRRKNVSQLIVLREGHIVGMITEEDLMKFQGDAHSTLVDEVMSDPPPTVSGNTSADTVRDMLLEFPAVVVMDRDRTVGILTKTDLIKRT